MSSNTEQDRIRDSYKSYRSSPEARKRWTTDSPGNRAIFEEGKHAIKSVLEAAGLLPLNGKKILEVGCGSGHSMALLKEYGVTPQLLTGIDLLPDRLVEARLLHPDVEFLEANAERLEFEDAAFDAVVTFTVFSSILDEGMAHNVAREIDRVLKPGGSVIYYDFRVNNPRNPQVRGVNAAKLRTLFPDYRSHQKTLTLLPPLARILGPLTKVLYPILIAIPFLRTHITAILIKPEGTT